MLLEESFELECNEAIVVFYKCWKQYRKHCVTFVQILIFKWKKKKKQQSIKSAVDLALKYSNDIDMPPNIV